LHVSKDDHITAIIDYAHTPDALKNVLQTINSIRKADQELITLIGCGGNRDRTKRPKMAGIAVEHSDKVIFTSDNPRDEDPQAILDEMMAQLSKEERNKTMAIVNRGEAIDEASETVRQNGIILIAGKGHENYQIIKGERMLFDDLEEVKEKLNKNNR